MKNHFKIKRLASMLLFVSITTGCYDSTKSSLNIFEGNLRGGLSPNEYALTFDDGPSVHTPRVLDALAKYGVKATFFVNGNQSKNRLAMLQRMKDEGHLVANHTFSHPSLPSLTESEILDQLQKTHEIIEPYVDNSAFFFRAPFGAWKLWIADFLNRAGLDFYVGNIFWDIGGVLTDRYAADWNCWSKGLTSYECGTLYLNEFYDRGSGIVLMHDVTSQTARMVEFILPKLVKKKVKFSRLDEIKKYRDKL
ncbi:polysaccharide deacetylase family protein [bacterium]|nr:polysaccharide deacetylase family protein [bacterium]